jgi:ribose transport system permease protein
MAQSGPVQEAGIRRDNWFKGLMKKNIRAYVALVIIVIVSILIAFESFTKLNNLMNVLNNIALFGGFAAIGMTYVIILGGIDLSVAAVMAFTANMLTELTQVSNNAIRAGNNQEGLWIFVMFVAVIGGAVVIGGLNGILVTYRKLEPFIVTLGTMTMLYGFNTFITQGHTINGVFKFLGDFGTGWITQLTDGTFFVGPVGGEAAKMVAFKIPLVPILFAVISVIFIIVLRKTVYGRHVYAVGGNAEAARLSGIKVERVKMVTYLLCAMLAMLNGLMLASWTGAYAPNMTTGLELDIIAAVVIGGTAMAGGSGTIGGTIAGMAVLAIILNILNLGIDLNVYGIDWKWSPDPYVRQFIKGIVILLAIVIQRRPSRK